MLGLFCKLLFRNKQKTTGSAVLLFKIHSHPVVNWLYSFCWNQDQPHWLSLSSLNSVTGTDIKLSFSQRSPVTMLFSLPCTAGCTEQLHQISTDNQWQLSQHFAYHKLLWQWRVKPQEHEFLCWSVSLYREVTWYELPIWAQLMLKRLGHIRKKKVFQFSVICWQPIVGLMSHRLNTQHQIST